MTTPSRSCSARSTASTPPRPEPKRGRGSDLRRRGPGSWCCYSSACAHTRVEEAENGTAEVFAAKDTQSCEAPAVVSVRNAPTLLVCNTAPPPVGTRPTGQRAPRLAIECPGTETTGPWTTPYP